MTSIMSNPVAELVTVTHKNHSYPALKIWCPGCASIHNGDHMVGGLHMLPVGGDADRHPVWTWNNDLELVTLDPSIKTSHNVGDKKFVCHSFLRNGMWEFLSDSTHELSGQTVAMVPLPTWCLDG